MEQSLSKRNDIAVGIQEVLQKAHQPKARAILFGSRARGDAHRDSDWDILILLDKEQITSTDKEDISFPIFELGWEINEMIHPIMYTVQEWETKNHTPFYKNVMKEGVTL
ncbi:MAG: nucleotidyltransferase domain-containing protein [Bacteroidaceae bacterium]|nr:nucleotidyltransferase domain-containing protein [Bacteroidaceae bacterium]